MDIRRIGTQPSGTGPAEYFTGKVRVDHLFEASDPARARCQRNLRARRSDSVAHAPVRPSPGGDGRLRPCTALGRPDRNHPAGRRGVDPAW